MPQWLAPARNNDSVSFSQTSVLASIVWFSHWSLIRSGLHIHVRGRKITTFSSNSPRCWFQGDVQALYIIYAALDPFIYSLDILLCIYPLAVLALIAMSQGTICYVCQTEDGADDDCADDYLANNPQHEIDCDSSLAYIEDGGCSKIKTEFTVLGIMGVTGEVTLEKKAFKLI